MSWTEPRETGAGSSRLEALLERVAEAVPNAMKLKLAFRIWMAMTLGLDKRCLLLESRFGASLRTKSRARLRDCSSWVHELAWCMK